MGKMITWRRGCILVSILMISLASCQKEDNTSEDQVATYLPPGGEAAIYRGNVNIITTPGNEIVIAADITDAVQRIDEVSEINFILQRKPGNSEVLNRRMENVKMVMTSNYLRIIPQDGGSEMVFTIESDFAAGEDAKVYEGYGLSENNGRWAFDMGFIRDYESVFEGLCANDHLLKDSSPGPTQTSDCPAGGPGSTSCSFSGGAGAFGIGLNCACSVSCGTGYYACCCNCIKCLCVAPGTSQPCNGTGIGT